MILQLWNIDPSFRRLCRYEVPERISCLVKSEVKVVGVCKIVKHFLPGKQCTKKEMCHSVLHELNTELNT